MPFQPVRGLGRRHGAHASGALAAAFALMQPGGVAAEPNPYYIGVSQAFGYDSNLFRLPTRTGDRYSSTGLVAGLDQPIGRQRLYASGNVRANRFKTIDALDNNSYGLTAGLDWATIERLSGNLSLSVNENLANYGGVDVQLQKKIIEKSSQFNARGQWGGTALLAVEAAYQRRQLRYSAPELAASEVEQDAVSVGLKSRPSSALTLGSALRFTHGKYPELIRATGGAETFDRKDIDLTAAWVPSALSTFNARLSLGKQDYDSATARDFSGATGALSWLYRPTGKLAFTTALSRDTGIETSFANYLIDGGLLTAIGDNSQMTTALTVNAVYEASAKIKVTAGMRVARRTLTNAGQLNGVPVATLEDTGNLRSVSLGATYAATRNWLFACNVGHDSRSSSGNVLSYPYKATTANCSAQFTWQ